MRCFIRYIKMKIAHNTLNELLEAMKKIPFDDNLDKSVEYTRDFIESWILSYEYKYRKKRFWKRINEEEAEI